MREVKNLMLIEMTIFKGEKAEEKQDKCLDCQFKKTEIVLWIMQLQKLSLLFLSVLPNLCLNTTEATPNQV